MNPKNLLGSVRRFVRHRIHKHHKARFIELEKRGIPFDRTWRLCEEIANAIPTQLIEREYTISAGQTQRLRTPYPSIEQYRKSISLIIHHMENERKIERGWSTFDMHDSTVADFLCSENRFYLSIKELSLFVNDVKELCQLMSLSEYDNVGVLAYNQRVLVHFFVHLKKTLSDLFDLQSKL